MNFSWIESGGAISFPNLGGFEINPPLGFSIGSLNIRFYGVIIAIGLLLAVWYGLKRSKQFGLTENDILDGVLGIVPVSVICARAFYCIFEWSDKYAAEPLKVFEIWSGGLAIYGGVIGALIGVLVYARIKKLKAAAVLDLVAISFLIGQFIGRWGNFVNREAFGSYTDSIFAMQIPASSLDGLLKTGKDVSPVLQEAMDVLKKNATAGGYSGFVHVHPTFLYESVWNVVGFVALHFLSKKRQYDGQIALGYAAWYGLGRALIEGLRMDPLVLGPFRVNQMLAAVVCFVAATILVIMAFRKHDKSKLYVNVVAAREAAALAAEAAAAEEAAAEETAEEAPAEEAPAEEVPAEETPAEETAQPEEKEDN